MSSSSWEVRVRQMMSEADTPSPCVEVVAAARSDDHALTKKRSRPMSCPEPEISKTGSAGYKGCSKDIKWRKTLGDVDTCHIAVTKPASLNHWLRPVVRALSLVRKQRGDQLRPLVLAEPCAGLAPAMTGLTARLYFSAFLCVVP